MATARTWSAFRTLLPRPIDTVLDAVLADPDAHPLAQTLAQAIRALEAPQLDARALHRHIDAALAHADCDRQTRIHAVMLAARGALRQGAWDSCRRLESQAHRLVDAQDPPPIAVAPWRVAWQRALEQRNPASEQEASKGFLAACGRQARNTGSQWLEWRARRTYADLARHRLDEARSGLDELGPQADALRQQTGWDLGRLDYFWQLYAGDLERAVDLAPDPFRRCEALLFAGDTNRARKLLAELPAGSLERLVAESTLALLVGDCTAAERDLTRAQHDQGHSIASERTMLRLAARVALAAGRGREAETALRRLDPHEDWGDCHAEWMACAWICGDHQRAATHLHALQRNGPATYVIRHLRFLPRLSAADLAAIQDARPAPPFEGQRQPAAEPSTTSPLVGTSPALAAVRDRIALVAPHREAVLITGPTGSGKELVAQDLYRQSCPAGAPFVALNCAAVPPSLAEAELFGYARGAFTGAERATPGALEQADGGILFLDEIGSMPAALQGLLLRVLESGDYQPLGDQRSRRFAGRIISATNVPLGDLVAAGSFRDDLLFRLQRLTIDIPPLRQRPDDIEPLCRHFLERMRLTRQPAIDPELITFYRQQPWPGNVRELRNDLEMMTVLHGDAERLTTIHSPLYQRTQPESAEEPLQPPRPPGGNRIAARRTAILEMARTFGSIARRDVTAALGCAPGTAANDLTALEQAGHLRRVIPNGAVRLTRFTPA